MGCNKPQHTNDKEKRYHTNEGSTFVIFSFYCKLNWLSGFNETMKLNRVIVIKKLYSLLWNRNNVSVVLEILSRCFALKLCTVAIVVVRAVFSNCGLIPQGINKKRGELAIRVGQEYSIGVTSGKGGQWQITSIKKIY